MNAQDNLGQTIEDIRDAAKMTGIPRVNGAKSVYPTRAERRNAWREQSRLERAGNPAFRPSSIGNAPTGKQLPPWRGLV